jgi:D-arabinose 5-phosphate isomerase GutQ
MIGALSFPSIHQADIVMAIKQSGETFRKTALAGTAKNFLSLKLISADVSLLNLMEFTVIQ